MNRTIKKVGEDADNLKANTAIAALMTMLNEFYDKGVNKAEYKTFLALLNPFAPHMTEEIWEQQGFGGMLNQQKWVGFDPEKCAEATVEIVVQLAGKIKARLHLAADSSKEKVLAAAKAEPAVAALIQGKSVVKEIYVPGKLVNLVVK